MAALEPGDPVVVFAGYDDASMDRFVAENPGLLRRVAPPVLPQRGGGSAGRCCSRRLAWIAAPRRRRLW